MRMSLTTIKAVTGVANEVRKKSDMNKTNTRENINIIFGFKFLETYRLIEIRRELNLLPSMMIKRVSPSQFAHLTFIIGQILIELDKEFQIRADRDLL